MTRFLRDLYASKLLHKPIMVALVTIGFLRLCERRGIPWLPIPNRGHIESTRITCVDMALLTAIGDCFFIHGRLFQMTP